VQEKLEGVGRWETIAQDYGHGLPMKFWRPSKLSRELYEEPVGGLHFSVRTELTKLKLSV